LPCKEEEDDSQPNTFQGLGRTDAKPRGKLSLLKLSRGAKEEDDSQWVNDRLDDDVNCLDNDNEKPRYRLSDDQVWQQIIKFTGVTNSSDFQKLNKDKQRETLRTLLDIGASVRQLQRLTGLGRGIIQRV